MLVGLAEAEILPDADVQRGALNVLINCVCGPPERVSCLPFIDDDGINCNEKCLAMKEAGTKNITILIFLSYGRMEEWTSFKK